MESCMSNAMRPPIISSGTVMTPAGDVLRAALPPQVEDPRTGGSHTPAPLADGPPPHMAGASSGSSLAPGGHLLPGEVPVLEQSGALPWRIGRCGSLRILLVTSRRRGRWIVPKGWLGDDPSPRAAAEREAYEEAGVIGTTSAAPFGEFRYLKSRADGSQMWCDVSLFGLKVRGTLLQWREKGQRRRKWCSLPEATELVQEPDLKRLLSELSAAEIIASMKMPAE
jgi:NTP pyrophosphohydrolases including oxidative damage repair enzymes